MQRNKYLGHEEFFSLNANFKNTWVMKENYCQMQTKKNILCGKKMLFYRQRKRKRDKVVTQIHNHQM